MADNPYLIPGTECLKNKLGIADKDELAKAEYDITSLRSLNLQIKPLPGKVDYDYFKAVHKSLFDGIYEWAGKERTVQTVKGYSRFEFPEKIEKTAKKLFDDLAKDNHLKGLDRAEFVEKAADYFCEINVVHPHPEGNGRTQKAVFDRIANDAGYEFNWNAVSRDQFIEAVVHAYAGDLSKLEEVFDKSLTEIDRSLVRDEPSEYKLSVDKPVSIDEYKKAVSEVTKMQNQVHKELYPNVPNKQSLDDAKKVKVGNEVKQRAPIAIETKNMFEAQQTVRSLLTELKTADKEIKLARENGDVKSERLLSQKMSKTLQKLVHRKSLSSQLSPEQRKMFQGVRKELNKMLTLDISKGIGL